jgi:uncharacterized protein
MGIFSKLSGALGISREMTLDEFMTASDAEDVDVMHKAASMYVKPIALQSDADVKVVEEELSNRNIVLLNISPMARNPQKLKAAVDGLRRYSQNLNGDMARIDEDKILLVPADIKIVKRRKE